MTPAPGNAAPGTAERFFRRLTAFQVRRPFALLAFILVLTLLAFASARKLELRTSLGELFPYDPELHQRSTARSRSPTFAVSSSSV